MKITAKMGRPVVTRGDWVFTTQFTGEGRDFHTQVVNALNALVSAAGEAGMPGDRFIRGNVMLTDSSLCERFLEIYREVVGPAFPTLSFVPERRLPDGSLFGIEVYGVTAASPAPERFYDESDFEGVPSLIRVGDYGFSSAILPTVGGSFEEECADSMDRLLRAMAAGGFEKRHFAKNLVLLSDCANFDAYNAVYARYYTLAEDPPARSLYGVSDLPFGRQVSVETVACLAGKETIHAEGGPSIALPFCHAARVGELVFISGQIGLQGASNMNLEFAPQTEQMLRNLALIAEAAGCRAEDALKFNAFVTDLANADRFHALFFERFGSDAAAPLYEVNGLAYPFIITEMDAIFFAR